jgi:recombination protein RecA
LEQNPEQAEVIEQLTRQKLKEGSEVTANSMKPLAAAAKAAVSTAVLADSGADAVEELPVAS